MTLVIQNAEFNGYDNTEEVINQGGYLVFYNIGETLHMANVLSVPKTQSHGVLYDLEVLKDQEGTYLFNWNYYNTYDNNKGTAIVKLAILQKGQGLVYKLKIIVNELYIITYKGYVEGSFND